MDGQAGLHVMIASWLHTAPAAASHFVSGASALQRTGGEKSGFNSVLRSVLLL